MISFIARVVGAYVRNRKLGLLGGVLVLVNYVPGYVEFSVSGNTRFRL